MMSSQWDISDGTQPPFAPMTPHSLESQQQAPSLGDPVRCTSELPSSFTLLLELSSGASPDAASMRGLDPDSSFSHFNKLCSGQYCPERSLNQDCGLPSNIEPPLVEHCPPDRLQQANSSIEVGYLSRCVQSSSQLRHVGQAPTRAASPPPLDPHDAVQTIEVS
eukprot:CAMPEP_0204351994 /NCGR_PEP_ID=MMETSP0469-20131031/31542_1 /ASSEMBLY_ACC=CAM_ASM_000384 /TAXON_ID=2969 /ORGANISM="Oxyrrhis marina" /LENGTH=163 /DNA_ID=CAMNT_0051338651 /DNA_START=1 /DNA_END=489 /DNA_ORIENTATION=+